MKKNIEIVSKSFSRNVNITSKKLTFVAKLIRGKNVVAADRILEFTQKKASVILRKLLKSATVNAISKIEYAGKLDVKDLLIDQIFIGRGKIQKRVWPRARGKTDIIEKVHSNVGISLCKIINEDIKEEKNG